MKPASGDQLDAFLQKMDDPNFWRTVKDPQTGQNVVLSEEDIKLIKRIKAQKIPDGTFDEYAVSFIGVKIYILVNIVSHFSVYILTEIEQVNCSGVLNN